MAGRLQLGGSAIVREGGVPPEFLCSPLGAQVLGVLLVASSVLLGAGVQSDPTIQGALVARENDLAFSGRVCSYLFSSKMAGRLQEELLLSEGGIPPEFLLSALGTQLNNMELQLANKNLKEVTFTSLGE